MKSVTLINADDSTLIGKIDSPDSRSTVAADLRQISKWCDLWGMRQNAENPNPWWLADLVQLSLSTRILP